MSYSKLDTPPQPYKKPKLRQFALWELWYCGFCAYYVYLGVVEKWYWLLITPLYVLFLIANRRNRKKKIATEKNKQYMSRLEHRVWWLEAFPQDEQPQEFVPRTWHVETHVDENEYWLDNLRKQIEGE